MFTLKSLIAVGCVILVTLSTGFAQSNGGRFFTDKTGKFRIRATIVDMNETKVKLRKADGSEIEVEVARLSDADQKFLTDQYRRYKEMVGDFPIGTAVEIFSTGGWHKGKILNVQPGKYYVKFDAYSDTWNKWVTTKELRLVPEPVAETKQDAAVVKMDASVEPVREPSMAANNAPAIPLSNITEPDSVNKQFPELKLPDAISLDFPFDHDWIQSRFFIDTVGRAEWKQPIAVESASVFPESSIDLPALDKKKPIGPLLFSHRKQKVLILQDSLLICVDLERGSVLWTVPAWTAELGKPLAISDSGRRLVCGVTKANGDALGLRVYNIDGLAASLVWQWRPEPNELPLTPARLATWLDDERLMVADKAAFAVWLPDKKLQRGILYASDQAVLQVSPGGGFMAWLPSTRLMMLSTVVPVTRLSSTMDLPSKTSHLSFLAGGSQLLASGGDQATLLDLRSGKISPLESRLLNKQQAEWIDADTVLVGGREIISLKQERQLAKLTSDWLEYAEQPLAWCVHDKLLLLSTSRRRLWLRPLSSLIDTKQLAQSVPAVLVDRGSKVSISVSGSALGTHKERVEKFLRSVIEKNGWVEDPSSDLKLSGSIEAVTETMEFDVTKIFAGKKTERIRPTYYVYSVRLSRGDTPFFNHGASTLATTFAGQIGSKSLEQMVTEQSQFRPNLIESIDVPAQVVAKPVEQTAQLIDLSKLP